MTNSKTESLNGREQCLAVGCERSVTQYRQCHLHLFSGGFEFCVSVASGLMFTVILSAMFVFTAAGAIESVASGALILGLLGCVLAVVLGLLAAFVGGFVLFWWPAETRFWRLFASE
jgi:ABC-type uncharacterized transport system permease subunit